MAELQKALLPKFIMAVDTGSDLAVSIPVGLGHRVFVKAESTNTTKVNILVLDQGRDAGGFTGDKADLAIVLTVAAAANQRPLIRELTRWIASAGTTDNLNSANSRVLYLDGRNLTGIPLATAISDVDVHEDAN